MLISRIGNFASCSSRIPKEREEQEDTVKDKILEDYHLNDSLDNRTDEDVQKNAVDSSRKKKVFRKMKSFFKKFRNNNYNGFAYKDLNNYASILKDRTHIPGVSGRWRSGRYERKFCSISRLWMVMVDTLVRVTRLMVDNDESSTMTADLTTNLSSWSVVDLSRPLPS
ncbi:hypothetical protein TNCV_2589371 [Trichonephila clavipes]|nr:hypothetical protein TNCV_2589371 [Trichonephila clavipes]